MKQSQNVRSNFLFRVCALGLCVCLYVMLGRTCEARAERTPSREYQIKASLIFNFLQFIRWPSDAPSDRVRICVLGPNPYGSALSAFEQQLLEGKRIEVLYPSDATPSAVTGCEVIIVTGAADLDDTAILQAVRNRGALTIGESPTFLAHGGVINLAVAQDKIVFDINRAAALSARLDLSSRLLRLARAVNDYPPPAANKK
jgi:hypothetical protein